MRDSLSVEGEIEDDVGFKNYDITSSPNDFNISTLFNLINEGIVKIPVFQRSYVWDQRRASKLIESIIMGLPIPQVFLYEKKKNEFLVIDGQQRLLSIFFFIKQRFPNEEGRRVLREVLTSQDGINDKIIFDDKYFNDFKLSLPQILEGQQNALNKLKFETLGEYKYSLQFLRTIRCIIIKQNSPDDESSMFEIFNRLNTGGLNLTPQEIRLSLFYSDLYDEIIKLNKNERWRTLLGQINVDIHFKDVEIILRAFALLEGYKNYKSPMNTFLNNYSKQGGKKSKEDIEYLKEIFIGFLNSCEGLDGETFRSNNGKFMISLFESVFVAVCYSAYEERSLPEVKVNSEIVKKIKEDTEFLASVQDGMASRANVQSRIKRVKEIIEHECIDN